MDKTSSNPATSGIFVRDMLCQVGDMQMTIDATGGLEIRYRGQFLKLDPAPASLLVALLRMVSNG